MNRLSKHFFVKLGQLILKCQYNIAIWANDLLLRNYYFRVLESFIDYEVQSKKYKIMMTMLSCNVFATCAALKLLFHVDANFSTM